MCFLEQCNRSISIILSSYSKCFIKCSKLVVVWLSEVQLNHCFIHLIFGNKYVYTLLRQRYTSTINYTICFSAIYRLNNWLGSKTPIIIAEYIKFNMLIVTLDEFFEFLVFP